MLKNLPLWIVAILLLTGCNSSLQRSANNKIFDTRGFDGGKRRPLYNKKYIDRAKKNIVQNNYEDYDDEYADSSYEADEVMDPYEMNLRMYNRMIKRDREHKRSSAQEDYDNGNRSNFRRGYSDVSHARDIAKSQSNTSSDENLRGELAEIKSMLASAKKDLAKYRCPMQNSESTDASVQKASIQSPSDDAAQVRKKAKAMHNISSDVRLIPKDKSLNSSQISSMYNEENIKESQ